jgi:hypothetical protein
MTESGLLAQCALELLTHVALTHKSVKSLWQPGSLCSGIITSSLSGLLEQMRFTCEIGNVKRGLLPEVYLIEGLYLNQVPVELASFTFLLSCK